MRKSIHVALNERVVVFKHGLPDKVLGPGKHTLWSRGVTETRYRIDELIFTAPAEVRAIVPSHWFEEARLSANQRGILYRDGQPVRFLQAGVHRFWTLDPTVELRVLSVDESVPELTDALEAIIPSDELAVYTVRQNERVVVFEHGLPTQVLGPGKHALWGRGVTETRFRIDELIFDASLAVRAVVPADWFAEVELSARQRGVLYREGKPVRFLRPGVHRYWTLDPSVELRIMSVDEAVPELTDELSARIPGDELVVATVRQFERGLMYVQGRFERMLDPGRYAFWSHPEARVVVQTIDMRVQQLAIQGQDLMTRDKVTLRLTLTVEYAPSDAPAVAHTVADVRDSVYLMVQLAAREYVAGVTLDELLEGRDAMTRYLEQQVLPKARDYGVEVHRVGVKDVILPGDMKVLLNRVIEAEKEAVANVIRRREEAASARQMANAAKVMADNPVLMRLKELEALQVIASNIDELKLVVGSDGLQAMLNGKALGA